MKKYIQSIIIFGTGLSILTACTKLDVDIQSTLTNSNFPKTASEYIAATGPAYTQLSAQYAQSYWFMQELSTDEAILVAKAGNWFDAGKWRDLHYHSWTIDQEHVRTTWQWGFNEISACNRILSIFEPLPDDASKRVSIAEVRATRALTYYYMMDLYGNIPMPKKFGDTEPLATVPRTQVFQFIEDELKQILPTLSKTVDATTYGRPTKYMAFSLLAKMYLNAEYYTGTPRYQDAVSMCDSVIQSKKFVLDADYTSMFAINNGPAVKEFIFSIPFDNVQAKNQTFARYSLHPILNTKYGLKFTPSNALSTLPSFYNLYTDQNDTRLNTWLSGKQYDNSGSPIIIKTTKVGYDQTYKGADANTTINVQLEFSPDLVLDLAVDPLRLDVSNDEKGKMKGYRNNKFFPDNTSADRNQSNDMPVFRYADILLMKAEAILRGASSTFGETPVSLTNQIRNRAKASTFSTMSLQNILDERGRELAFEGWRRNDLIRFGKWEDKWGYKTDASTFRRIYPVPAIEKQLNPKLTQNPGY